MNKYDSALHASGGATSSEVARIMADPRFQTLVSRRSSFAWLLSAIMLVIYLGFTLLTAFAPGLMATTPFGGVTSLGIALGVLVILAAFVLTGIYVSRANREFDGLAATVKDSVR